MNECARIYSALLTGKGWIHHPATKMWEGYENALHAYAIAIANERFARGAVVDKNWDFICTLHAAKIADPTVIMPPWLNGWEGERIRWTHRASLYRKDPDYYKQYYVDDMTIARNRDVVLCCAPGKHDDYYYPTHGG